MKNFFEHQDAARKNTTRLIVLFGLAMLLTMVCLYLVALVSMRGFSVYERYSAAVSTQKTDPIEQAFVWWDTEVFFFSVICTLLVVGGGTLWKTRQLARGGGSLVCEQLGGRFIDLRTDDFKEKRLINVVQEMAIASGVSVPLLYVLDQEQSINAFAAGFTTNNAAVAVSRGALDLLNRDELQGVIAHEFSHILNGDMRMNIRMIGVLHGVLMIGVAGLGLFRAGIGSGFRGRSRNSQGALPLIFAGAALAAIGYGGRLVGTVIKSAISRQREFLADASAVQFTRNPDGLSGALQKIGGWPAGSLIESPSAEQVSHMFFGDGIKQSFFSSWFLATHPPLKARIRRVDPKFSGAFPMVRKPTPIESDEAAPARRQAHLGMGMGLGHKGWKDKHGAVENTADLLLAGAVLSADGGSPMPQRAPGAARHAVGLTGESALQAVGQTSQEHVNHARDLLNAIPDRIREAARDPFGASSVAFAMLLDTDANIRIVQLEMLGAELTVQLAEETRTAAELLKNLDATLRLPLLEILVPALRTLSQPQYERFIKILDKLIYADDKVTLFEFSLKKLIEHRLVVSHGEQTRHVAQFYSLAPLREDIQVLLSHLAHAGSEHIEEAQTAFAEAVKALGEELPLLPAFELSFDQLDVSLDRIAKSINGVKRRIVRATATCVLADQDVAIGEAQLLRVMCEVIDVPLPPFLPQVQPATP